MKHCPKCQREYADETLNFCLDDGEWLREEVGEPVTAILNSEAPTRVHNSPTAENADTTRAERALFAGAGKTLFVAAVGLLIVAALGIGGYWFYADRAGSQVRSIAVLPFTNESGNAEFEYISDGLPETLIYRLSQIPELQVSPRSSVFRYKGRQTEPAVAARELGADAVLSGSVAQRGDNLIINVDLIDARTGKLIWGEQYDRKSRDLLATQREIAREIVGKLKLKVSPHEKALAKQYTESNDAYNFYLKGRFYWNKRTGENIKKAIGEFQKAADADPDFALAYVGIADCYLILEQYAGTPSSETLPKARAAAQRALEIDDSLAEAHNSMAKVNQEYWQLAEAEKGYKRAIELNPNYATAHHWYSILLTALGRSDEAMAEIMLAQKADPLSPIIAINIGNQYILRANYEAAAAQYQRTLELDPNFPRAITDLGFIYAKQGREQEAISYLQRAVNVTGKANEELSFLGYGYGVLGRRAEAIAVLKELEARHARRETPALYPAAVYGALGDKDQAFAWLEKDLDARTALLPYITILPLFDTLRDDPRYTDLLRRMGFR